jgi:hypothetical protein
VAAGGGTVSPVTKLDTEAGEIAHRYPSFLPDGKSFLYVAATADAARVAIKVGSLDLSAEHRVLLDAGSAAVFADGYLLYVAAGTLMARPFDPVRLAFTGEARVLADAVGMTFGNTNNLGGQPSFSASPGVLAYVSQDLGQFTWRDRAGNVVGVLGDPGVLGRPELSPDGKRASVIVSQNAQGHFHLRPAAQLAQQVHLRSCNRGRRHVVARRQVDRVLLERNRAAGNLRRAISRPLREEARLGVGRRGAEVAARRP